MTNCIPPSILSPRTHERTNACTHWPFLSLSLPSLPPRCECVNVCVCVCVSLAAAAIRSTHTSPTHPLRLPNAINAFTSTNTSRKGVIYITSTHPHIHPHMDTTDRRFPSHQSTAHKCGRHSLTAPDRIGYRLQASTHPRHACQPVRWTDRRGPKLLSNAHTTPHAHLPACLLSQSAVRSLVDEKASLTGLSAACSVRGTTQTNQEIPPIPPIHGRPVSAPVSIASTPSLDSHPLCVSDCLPIG
mmetsp:Transcript_36137/g.90150  ORF Transcript_36137/g.90150 Transcript_36137/m.90150 type:complete len:244 (-) Transcript_36137:1074-1805(-)